MNSDAGNSSRPTSRRWQFSLRSMFWLTTVAGFYAWIFIAIEPLLLGPGREPLPIAIFEVVWLYYIVTVVTVLMFRTRGKVIIGVIIGVAAGFSWFNLPSVLIAGSMDAPSGVGLITGLLFFGSHGAGICGGIDAIIRKHWGAGWTAIILTWVSFCVLARYLAM